MPKIFSYTQAVAALSSSERASMFGLLSIEFFGVSREDFIRDLNAKDNVILLRKENCKGEIVGFSTIATFDLYIVGRRVKAIFSGDTTVLPEYRRSPGLAVEMGNYFLNALEIFPSFEIFYILISKGWRSYKVLPFSFKHFAPKFDTTINSGDKAVMDAFGELKYREEYNQKKGLILFSRQTQRLIPGNIDAIPPKDPDSHTKYFLLKNPTYLSGTELVCVAPVKKENFALPFKRLLKL